MARTTSPSRRPKAGSSATSVPDEGCDGERAEELDGDGRAGWDVFECGEEADRQESGGPRSE